jgi:hypothetical protein
MKQTLPNHRKAAMELMDAMAVGDLTTLRGNLHRDVRWHIPPSVSELGLQPTLIGVQAVLDMINASHRLRYLELTRFGGHANISFGGVRRR